MLADLPARRRRSPTTRTTTAAGAHGPSPASRRGRRGALSRRTPGSTSGSGRRGRQGAGPVRRRPRSSDCACAAGQSHEPAGRPGANTGARARRDTSERRQRTDPCRRRRRRSGQRLRRNARAAGKQVTLLAVRAGCRHRARRAAAPRWAARSRRCASRRQPPIRRPRWPVPNSCSSASSPPTRSASGAEIAPPWRPMPVVLSLQNGVENADTLARCPPDRTVLPAVVYVATAMPEPRLVRHFGRGDLVVGPRHGQPVDARLRGRARRGRRVLRGGAGAGAHRRRRARRAVVRDGLCA